MDSRGSLGHAYAADIGTIFLGLRERNAGGLRIQLTFAERLDCPNRDDPACKSDCRGGAGRKIYGGCLGNDAAHLPVAKGLDRNRRCDQRYVHDAHYQRLGQRDSIQGDSDQYCGQRYQQSGHTQRHDRPDRTFDHHPTGESNGDHRPGGDFYRHRFGGSAVELSVAEKRISDFWGNIFFVHDVADFKL